MYKKILLPTDGSHYADQEVERVTDLIADDGEIIILSVAGKMTSSAFQGRRKIRKANAYMRNEAEKAVSKMASKFDDSLNVRTMVRSGFAAETITDVAEELDVDLIAISSSGKSSLNRFVLGSVTEEVLKTAEVDVLLVHNE